MNYLCETFYQNLSDDCVVLEFLSLYHRESTQKSEEFPKHSSVSLY